MAKQFEVEIPEKLGFLFEPSRYKVARGGRGSGKSWSFARALLVLGVAKKERILCAREIQNSIKDSVHKLLADQIALLGLGHFYTVQEQTIRGRNGTEFIFSGLSSQTVESIKSFEGIDRVWVEEAKNVSKRSWDILLPTIRTLESEVWISYNPELESDETHIRFTLKPPTDCINVEINYYDNPWFNDILEQERQDCLRRDPDNYPNIWEGKCLPAVAGAIYFKEVQLAESKGRITRLPYDPMLKVHVVFDLGWNDNTSVVMAQRKASALFVIDYIEDSRRTLDSYSAELKDKRYNWGRVWLPHDGFSGSVVASPPSDILQALGWDVVPRHELAILPLESGIQAARQAFGQVYFDQDKCGRLIECLKRYRRNINNRTQAETSPLHDEFSHGADCFRYMCVNAEQMHNEDRRMGPVMQPFGVLDRTIGY